MFEVLFEKRPDLQAKCKTQVVAVQGDLSLENLGMDPVQRKEIVENLDILINSAASIYFNDPLMELLKTNYYGAVRILELANECKKLEVFSHVSTAYVCSN